MPPGFARPIAMRGPRWSSPAREHAGRTVISRIDRQRLFDSLPWRIPMPPHLSSLMQLLSSATAVPPREIPPDLVTMNSTVRIQEPISGRIHEHPLVYPYQAELMPMGTSITAPTGAALFGKRIGDLVRWTLAGSERTAIILDLAYQPEREMHYDR